MVPTPGQQPDVVAEQDEQEDRQDRRQDRPPARRLQGLHDAAEEVERELEHRLQAPRNERAGGGWPRSRGDQDGGGHEGADHAVGHGDRAEWNSGSALIETWIRLSLCSAASLARSVLFVSLYRGGFIESRATSQIEVHGRPDADDHPDQDEQRPGAQPAVEHDPRDDADDHRQPEAQAQIECDAPVLDRRAAAGALLRPIRLSCCSCSSASAAACRSCSSRRMRRTLDTTQARSHRIETRVRNRQADQRELRSLSTEAVDHEADDETLTQQRQHDSRLTWASTNPGPKLGRSSDMTVRLVSTHSGVGRGGV